MSVESENADERELEAAEAQLSTNYTIPDIHSVDSEVTESIDDVHTIQFSNKLQFNGRYLDEIRDQVGNEVVDISNQYSVENELLFEDLEITIGDNKITRYSCACHKLNIAVRHAISQHSLSDILKSLNSSNRTIRKVIELNSVFRNKKCRLRLENLTRWSSAYLMLESVKRAYDRGAFNENVEELTCPVSLESVETYLQILKPAYLLSMGFQSNTANISSVIPGILRALYAWENMDVSDPIARRLCVLLIANVKHKFSFELNSDIYKVCKIIIEL